MFTLAIVVLAKLGTLAKAAKIAKPAITFGSMAFSAFAYAFWLGPWFAIGLIAMLFIHEMGHVIALRLKGYPASTPVFIPFLGAAIFAPRFPDRDSEAYVGYGGPLLGSVAAAGLFGVWFFLPENSIGAHLVLITSYAAVFLNLFNMIPLSPLDGGRITQATGRWFQYVGIITLAMFSILLREPAILLIWVLVIAELHINRKVKLLVATLCAIGMGTLMALGYSHQHWAINVFDCVLVTIFVVVMALEVVMKDAERAQDTRPDLPATRRVRWFVLYAGLTMALVLLIAYQTHLLPQVTQ